MVHEGRYHDALSAVLPLSLVAPELHALALIARLDGGQLPGCSPMSIAAFSL